jgi:plasmid maintenance system killer protein
VIVSYRDKRTKDFAAGKRVKAFFGIERAARLKLDRLDAAVVLRDVAALPGNRFEAGIARVNTASALMTSGGFVLNGLEQHPAR